ncbi:MAG: peptidoglycan DD-metalloendopeptidase family protein [Flavobacteriaceae bacterium]|nr:peptidoglycan DD-metalloendopeptidase family protein [Flavobacteriaceae bacterium]
MNSFEHWAQHHQVSLHELFPTLDFEGISIPNMGKGSTFFGDDPQHENLTKAELRLNAFQKEHPETLIANGYLEQREFYNTPNYERVTNGTKEYRNIHLGTDFWVPALTPLHCVFDGVVVISHHNDIHKDYGPLIVLEHEWEQGVFYTLYGHLSKASLSQSPKGKKVKKGMLLGSIGTEKENGHWVPHLHFQLITDLLENTKNYNGVAYPSEIERWKQLCPNPNFIFKEALD